MAAALEQEWQHYLVESSFNIDPLVIDAVANCVLLDIVCVLVHQRTILVGYLGGVHLQAASSFEVDELGGAAGIVKEEFVAMVKGVEQNHFVFGMAQVSQGVHQGVVVVGFDQGVGKDDHERSFVELFGGEVQGLAYLCAFGGGLVPQFVGGGLQ